MATFSQRATLLDTAQWRRMVQAAVADIGKTLAALTDDGTAQRRRRIALGKRAQIQPVEIAELLIWRLVLNDSVADPGLAVTDTALRTAVQTELQAIEDALV
jgi:hypothetical protein